MENEDETIQKGLEYILNSVALSKNITNYEVVSNSHRTQGDGFLSEFFTGEVLDKNNDKTIQVAIKKAPMDGYTSGFGHEVIYKNEIYFYSDVFPELDTFQKEKKVKDPFNNIPEYFAGNLEPTNMFVAMENLKAVGYTLFDKKKFLDSEHLELIFKTYGKWHALSFVFKHKNAEGYTNLVNNLTNLLERLPEQTEWVTHIEKGFLAAIETFDPITEADILEKLKTLDIIEILKSVIVYKGSYKCLTHGDCWSNNMLFKYKESGELEDMKLIDFQIAGTNSPIHDLSYFFYSGASKQDMDKIDYYLDVYYQSFSNFAKELGENAEEIFPLEILKKEWKQYGAFGIALGCLVWLVKLMDRKEITNMLEQKGLSLAEYGELLNERMDKVNEEAVYRERVRNICLHAVEYGLL